MDKGTIIENVKYMTPALLMKNVMSGVRVDAEVDPRLTSEVFASVMLDNDMIVIFGATGVHRLNLTFTNPERLAAHWSGYKVNARTEALRGFKHAS